VLNGTLYSTGCERIVVRCGMCAPYPASGDLVPTVPGNEASGDLSPVPAVPGNEARGGLGMRLPLPYSCEQGLQDVGG